MIYKHTKMFLMMRLHWNAHFQELQFRKYRGNQDVITWLYNRLVTTQFITYVFSHYTWFIKNEKDAIVYFWLGQFFTQILFLTAFLFISVNYISSIIDFRNNT